MCIVREGFCFDYALNHEAVEGVFEYKGSKVIAVLNTDLDSWEANICVMSHVESEEQICLFKAYTDTVSDVEVIRSEFKALVESLKAGESDIEKYF